MLKRIRLIEADELEDEMLNNETVADEVEEIQDDTVIDNGEGEESELEMQLNEMREVLVDLDLNLYQITSTEDKNNTFYVIGKVAEEHEGVLLLVDNEEESEEPFDFVNIPSDFESIATLSPRYGENVEETDHNKVMGYLMELLVEVNPSEVEDLDVDTEIEGEEVEIEDEEN